MVGDDEKPRGHQWWGGGVIKNPRILLLAGQKSKRMEDAQLKLNNGITEEENRLTSSMWMPRIEVLGSNQIQKFT